MVDKILVQEIAGEIDIDGLWYWLWQRDYRRHADKFPVDLLKQLIECSDKMNEVEKILSEEGYVL